MEKRQLDFNAPFLSARRYSSPSHSTELGIHKAKEKPLPVPPHRQHSLPVKRSDWENEGLTKPAAVPFHWEQVPGRPKGELSPDESVNIPRLPPAMVSDAIRRSGESPKLPPGRVSGPSRYVSGERSNDQNIYRAQGDPLLYNDHAMLLEKLNESLSCKDESDSESGEVDVYSDALNALSVTESCSLSYGVSGLSSYQSSGVKPSGTFTIDKQTREFMMDRFLPAAKAAVIETPQYIVKKPPVLNEPPKLVRKAVSGEVKPSPRLYTANTFPYYNQHNIENVESDDDDQQSNAPAKKLGKVWGILPRFCVKNSLCLLNPMPGMRSGDSGQRARTPPPFGEVKRIARKALSGPLDKVSCQSLQDAYHVPHKKKNHSGVLSHDLSGVVDYKPNHDSNQFFNTHGSVRTALSPLRRYRSGNVSPHRNELSKSPFRQGIVPKGVKNQNANKIASSHKLCKALLDVSRNQVNERGLSSPAVNYSMEETLHVDFIGKTQVPVSKLPAIKQAEDTNVVKTEERKKLSPKEVEDAKVGYISDGKLRTKDEKKFVVDDTKGSDPPLQLPLPPPLPKSPSESWLWRTLPSIPLGNPFAHSRQRNNLQSKHGQKGSATDTKWERIVKTSNLQHVHV